MTKFADGSAQTGRRWRKRENSPALDLPYDMKKNLTNQLTKSKQRAPHIALLSIHLYYIHIDVFGPDQ